MSAAQTAARPMLAQPRTNAASNLLDKVIEATGKFDADMWMVMDRRDNSLIEQEILQGAGSNKFVYRFNIKKTEVTGISVVGARHLAAHYGGLRHRIVASVQKVGSLHTFTSYPQERTPMRVECSVIHELASEPDYYAAVVEIQDVKSGNSIQMEAREERFGEGQFGTYEKPHYAKIAQSKAYRNAVLALVPQDVIIKWSRQMLDLGKDEVITESVIDEKRAGILKFAAKHGLPIERGAVEALMMEQIAGLAEAAREGKLPAFAQAAQALGLLATGDDQPMEQQKRPQQRGRQKAQASDDRGPPQNLPPHDPETGEVHGNGAQAPAETNAPSVNTGTEEVQQQPGADAVQAHSGNGARKELF